MGAFFGRFFAGLGNMLAAFFGLKFIDVTSKFTTRLAVFAVLITLFLALLTRLTAVVTSLTVTVPASVAVAFSWIIPSNFVPCISAAISIQLIIWLWKWKQYAIEFAIGFGD